ncbi:hypothetical protein [Methanopyrus kandleri]
MVPPLVTAILLAAAPVAGLQFEAPTAGYPVPEPPHLEDGDGHVEPPFRYAGDHRVRVYPCSVPSTAWVFLEDRRCVIAVKPVGGGHPVLLLDVSDLVVSVGADGVRLRGGYAAAVRMEPVDFPSLWTPYEVVTGSGVELLFPWLLGPIVRECSRTEFERVAELVAGERGSPPEDVETGVWDELRPPSPVPLPMVPFVSPARKRRSAR